MRLEDYIQKNRQGLDVEQPDEELIWAGIAHSVRPKAHMNGSPLWKYIAAVAATVAITLSVVHFADREPKQQLVFINIDPNLAQQEVELKDQIQHFSKLINQSNISQSDLPTSQSELQYLDDLIEKYTQDLKKFGPNPKLIESLMDLYNKKVMILQRMLNEIEKIKKYEERKISI
jgi:hypothetical protein